MEEQNQNWKDVVYEQDPEEKKQKKGRKKMPKRMKLVIGAAVAAVVLLPAAAGSFYQIQEQEQAVLVTFGKPKAVTETGLHLKLPLIQQVKKVNTTIQGFPVGYNEADNEVDELERLRRENLRLKRQLEEKDKAVELLKKVKEFERM